MNIFFLSFKVKELANLYCDQHVVKILLEICQMLYTAWYFSGEYEFIESHAPFKKDGKTRGYKKAHTGHPTTMWVASHKNNYRFASILAMALSMEHTKRFGTIHACAVHAKWLHDNIPSHFKLRINPKAYYATQDVPKFLTPIPECMPDPYKHPSILISYKTYYTKDKLSFARWSNKD